ncbi:hypothetical protein [Streptomyces sp. NPDC058653]|uniref:hypothetical protein n=1 Tax=Streptomyces sp. NPDC058653 TaxID=3346576 RepID=UPI003647D6DE
MATTSVRRLRGQQPNRRGLASLTALTALAALTVAGCAGSDETDGAGANRSDGKGGAHATPSPERPTSASPARPSVSAADGGDASACADGDCEITVSGPVTFPIKGPAGPATVSVTEVGENKIEYTVKSGNSHSQSAATGPGQGCVTVLRTTGSGNSCGGLGAATRPGKQPDAVVIQAAAGGNGTAIIHIVSH